MTRRSPGADGATVRGFMLPSFHWVTVFLSGVSCPGFKRSEEPGGADLAEPFASEAKYFVESRLLNRDVRVLLFVADGADASQDTLDLFAQLYHAPWAKRTSVLLLLTKADLLREQLGATRADAALQDRAEAYRRVCTAPLSVRFLNALDERDVRALVSDLAGVVARQGE